MLEAESLVEVHGVRDGVVPLQGDDGQGEHGELRTENSEKAGNLTGS